MNQKQRDRHAAGLARLEQMIQEDADRRRKNYRPGRRWRRRYDTAKARAAQLQRQSQE